VTSVKKDVCAYADTTRHFKGTCTQGVRPLGDVISPNMSCNHLAMRSTMNSDTSAPLSPRSILTRSFLTLC